jgi:hypothetical protein
MGTWTCACNTVCGVNTLTFPASSCVCNVNIDPPGPQPTGKCNAHQTSWTNINPGDIILDDHIQEIRDALDDEYNRRNLVRIYHVHGIYKGYDSNTNNITVSAGTYTNVPLLSGEIIENVDVEELYTQISAMKTMIWTTNVQYPLTDEKITDVQLEELRSKINDCENDCLCDCDYCNCNCNYCTCDCNYCTCNCNHCTCNCDYYSCPCDCNNCGSNSCGDKYGCNGRGCRAQGGW